jgi:hypothetical protein
MNESVTIPETRRDGLSNSRVLRGVEIGLAVALSLAWIIFRVRFFLHAGALWRDEINSVNISTSPSLSNIWHNLQYDSFPMLWHLILRLWIRSGIGSTDLGLRLLGLLTGLGTLAAIFFNSHRFRTRPLIVLALLGFSSTAVCDGGAVRGYGLGMMLELLTFGLMWDVAVRPSALRSIAALLVALASVQMLFYNNIVLAAVCCGAFAVAASHRQWKRAAIVIGIGAICAASTLVYLPVIHDARSFLVMLDTQPSLSWLSDKFAEAVSYNPSTSLQIASVNLAAWKIAILAALYLGGIQLVRSRPADADPTRKDLAIYLWTVLCVGFVGYCWLLWHLYFPIRPWHSLALMALVATCADGLIGSYRGLYTRAIVCIAVIAVCCVAAPPLWADSGLRKTAIDSDVVQLQNLGKKGDLILVSPWFYGITFERYYRGSADFVAIPPVESLANHNYTQLFPAMQNIHEMDPILARIAGVLKSGHTVFLFGDFQLPSLDPTYPTLDRPAPDNSFGWIDSKYYDLWERQIEYFAAHHATQATLVHTDSHDVSDYERPWLFAVSGWSDASDRSTTK